ncbi:fimbrial assembly protein [Neobacillus niacini]|uniref:fimbrial assembly protein n=1 Tax=Neobacillus niacini TaxID=86668 RepID=UPI00285C5731|nr:fimbrial assembly protein [Neobacillus niacini]MDR7001481.1 type IV pilus assembly protein PilN [Neobacillus niacini]
MQVNINLLPKRDEKNIAFFVIAAICLLFLIILTVTFIILLNGKKQDLAQIEKQVAINQTILDEQNQKLSAYKTSNSVVQLEDAIKWAKNQPFNMVYVLQQLTKSLPQRGFILDFNMDEKNLITQQVQFDTKSDAAYYLNSILEYPWIDEAVVTDLKNANIDKNTNQTSSQDTMNGDVDSSNILPRYDAEYEIRIDLEKLKATSQKEEKMDKGGISP